MIKYPKQEIIRDAGHRRFISDLPCCVSGLENNTQAAHIRHGEQAGLGRKPDDRLCTPLSWYFHSIQHKMGSEINFWEPYGGVDKAKQLARDLYAVTGNHDAALKLIREFKCQ